MRTGRYSILFFILITGLFVSAQTGINSPYSRFGLGQLYSENQNVISMSMGGIAIGLHDPTAINPANPASYGSLDSSMFLFEAALSGNYTGLKTTTQTESSNDITLRYMYLGFPISNWWKIGAGVMPFSKIGYDVEVTADVEKFSNVVHAFTGDGGINQVFLGNGFNITENLRAGVDITYLFGKSTRTSMIYFPDSLYIFGTKVESNVRMSDFVFNYGIQYDIPLNSSIKLTLGANYANKFNARSNRNYLSYTLLGGYDDIIEYVKDTIEYNPDEKGNIVIPQRFGVGFTLVSDKEWLVGGDFAWQNWKEYSAFGQSDSLNNSWRVAMGGSFKPSHTNISKLYRRLTYRLGARYNHSYLNYNGTNINEFGISFGVTFPMKKSNTEIDLGFEIGRRGTTRNELIQENFFNFSLGVSIQEHWFQKRKYQ